MGLCCSDRENQPKAKTKNTLTRNEWFTLFAIGSVHFGSAICVSLQAPFYPQEAESKNATSTEYGFVFGIYELVSFISSPLLGNYIDVIGAKLLLNSGIVLAAVCSILFGLLDLVTTHIYFIVLSFLIRMFEALGSAAAVTSAFAITAAAFPDNVATTFATLEIFYGLGYIAGPTIGGFLYTLGGYILPFVIMGTVLLLDGIFVYFILPTYKKEKPKPKASMIEIFKVPPVIIDSLSIMCTSIAMGFYSATLEPHIREFDLSPISLGLIFVISGATYACTAPLIGRLCDVGANPKSIILIGSILVVIGVFFIGPAPFIPLEPTLSLVIIGLIFQGLGMACILVSGFIDAIRSAVAGGFPDEISTYGLMSGLWSASFSLGDFIGPSVAGALNDLVGFRYGTLFIVAVHGLIFTTLAIFLYRTRKTKTTGYEKVAIFTVGANEKGKIYNNYTDIESNLIPKANGNGYGSVSNGSLPNGNLSNGSLIKAEI